MENRMVRDTEAAMGLLLSDVQVRLNATGWKNITDGTFVPEEVAFDYAIDHCTNFVPSEFHKIEWTQEFKKMVVEWFYSGDWVKEE